MTETYLDLVSEREVEEKHQGDFGCRTSRQVIDEGVLKVASGYWIGSTCQQILISHGLMFIEKGELHLTKKGREYLWRRFQVFLNPSLLSKYDY